MRDLEQRFRELDKDSFELFVHQYLIAKYPGAGIKKVDGAGGDAGVDSFSGMLLSGPAIWQSKFFSRRIKQPQKRQILESIAVAFKEHSPSVWTLCVPIDLRNEEHRWFQSAVVSVFGGKDQIKLLQATDFLGELLYNRPLRDAFFPRNAVSEALELRRITTKTEDLSSEEVGRLVTEYGQQFLAGKMDIEPRLRAVLTIGNEPEDRLLPSQPGWVMSSSFGGHTINYFALDPKTYNLDPIKFSVKIPLEEHTALQEALETGRPFSVPAGKIRGFESSSPLLASIVSATDIPNLELDLQPRLPEALASRETPLRFIAGLGESTKELYYVPFRAVRVGTREVVLSSRTALPIQIDWTLRLPAERGAKFNFRPVYLWSEITALDLVLQFLDEIRTSGHIEIRSVETNAPVFNEVNRTLEPGLTQTMRAVIANGALVSRFFGVPLHFKERITKHEVEDLQTLSLIASGEPFFELMLDGTITKSATYSEAFIAGLNQSVFPVRIDHPGGWRTFEVFGQYIQTGPVTFVAENAVFVDVDIVRQSYLAARCGQDVPMRIRCDGPCRWICARGKWDPRSAFQKGVRAPDAVAETKRN
jgi:hypothetical protein